VNKSAMYQSKPYKCKRSTNIIIKTPSISLKVQNFFPVKNMLSQSLS
jgi:hypothetical protein